MPAPSAYSRRTGPIPGPSSYPTGNGQVASYNLVGGLPVFAGWITPFVPSPGASLTLSGASSGSTAFSPSTSGNLSVTTTTSVGGLTAPAMIFNAVGTWNHQNPMISFRRNGIELCHIDGIGAIRIAAGSSAGFDAPSLTPESGGQCYIGQGMRRSSTTGGFRFAWGESISSTATPGFEMFPIGGTHIEGGILFKVWKNATKTISPFSVLANGGVTMPLLPTANPAVAGVLWNDAGTVKISAG